jgi:hypothetical protein
MPHSQSIHDLYAWTSHSFLQSLLSFFYSSSSNISPSLGFSLFISFYFCARSFSILQTLFSCPCGMQRMGSTPLGKTPMRVSEWLMLGIAVVFLPLIWDHAGRDQGLSMQRTLNVRVPSSFFTFSTNYTHMQRERERMSNSSSRIRLH